MCLQPYHTIVPGPALCPSLEVRSSYCIRMQLHTLDLGQPEVGAESAASWCLEDRMHASIHVFLGILLNNLSFMLGKGLRIQLPEPGFDLV